MIALEDTRIAVASVLKGDGPILCEASDALPAAPGAYALFLRLVEEVRLDWRGTPMVLRPGSYIYAGSAHGSGGLRARLSRHFREPKRQHWHIDRLTQWATDRKALAIIGGTECQIVSRCLALGGFTLPIDGFGSSDCRSCPSHLLLHESSTERPV
jgi:Uri superfamily endonuclease